MEFDVKSDPMCSIRLLGVVLVSFFFSLNLCAEDRLTGISLPTGVAAADQLGVYFFYQGDDNDNSTCHIEYRKMGEIEWKATWRLHVDRALKQFHGSLGGLEPETAYEIRLNILDEDGARDTKELKLKTLPSGAKIPPGQTLPPVMIQENASGQPGSPSSTISKGTEGEAAPSATQEGSAAAILSIQEPRAVATFESLSIYLPAKGINRASSRCGVEFREVGTKEWREGYPLQPDPQGREFRGSLVQLQPDTEYEIRLTATGGGFEGTRELRARTWSENFKIDRVVTVSAHSDKPLQINQSGSKENGYVLYQGPGGAAVIDVKNQHENCVLIQGSYVIIRGLTLKGAKADAIRIVSASDVVVEKCDISGWGRFGKDQRVWGMNDAAIAARGSEVKRIVIQRNRIHDPRCDANTWSEPRPDKGGNPHPIGPQGTFFWETGGNHVIRFNHIWGSEHHYYNDGIGGGQNNSLAGFPNCDSDIHGNIVENVWDDGIESEGGNANVRIWGNFLNECTQAIATRGNARGPVYIWRNVFGKSKWNPKGEKGGYFSKAGFNDHNRGDHGTYIFHNTILQPGGAGKGIVGPVMYAISRNNILDADVSIDYRKKKEAQNAINANDFDYDLITGKIEVPSGMETERHGRRGNPLYVTGSGFDRKTLKGIFQLAPVSPGFDSGARIPNFNDLFDGKAPDMGAHESGFTPMEFGPEATRSFPVPIQ
jgi:hypothetical protein